MKRISGWIGGALALASLTLFSPAAMAAPAYAPPSRPGPRLSVPASQVASALQCSSGVANAKRTPVLLVPGTGASAHDNFSWNYEPAFDKLKIPWCAITFPFNGNGDIQINGEYVVYAIRTMHGLAGRRIAIVGHSQGGMVPRWALRFWPDTRPMVDDLIGFAPSNHGTTQTKLSCHGSCIEANWQQAYMSHFIQALNSYQETFAGISYTNVYTHADEVVQPNENDRGSSSLHGGGGRIANIAVQEVCPSDTPDHNLVGTTDPVAYALAIDALTHAGPADKRRIPVTVCAQGLMPGVNPITGPAAGLKALTDDETSSGPTTPAEPALACYVFAACRQPVPRPPACTARLRFRLRAGRHHRVVAVQAFVDGHRVASRRGHNLKSLTLGRLRPGAHVIRIVVRTENHTGHASVYRTTGCRLARSHPLVVEPI